MESIFLNWIQLRLSDLPPGVSELDADLEKLSMLIKELSDRKKKLVAIETLLTVL